MENLLSIEEKKEKVNIDEEKLGFIATNMDIWDHFGITRSQYVSLSAEKNLKVLKTYYKYLAPVYFDDNKKVFCCSDCLV